MEVRKHGTYGIKRIYIFFFFLIGKQSHQGFPWSSSHIQCCCYRLLYNGNNNNNNIDNDKEESGHYNIMTNMNRQFNLTVAHLDINVSIISLF